MAKPTGKSGYFQATSDGDGNVTGGFVQTDFPRLKSETEVLIAEGLLRSIDREGGVSASYGLRNLSQNAENDFDFTVDTPTGAAQLELAEIAPLKGPYDTAASSYNVYQFAQTILSGIKAKSEHYASDRLTRIFLLAYTTHWAFAPSQNVIRCLRHWCAQEDLNFEGVFLYSPFDDTQGSVDVLYKLRPDQLEGFNPEEVRESICFNGDPSKMTIVRSN